MHIRAIISNKMNIYNIETDFHTASKGRGYFKNYFGQVTTQLNKKLAKYQVFLIPSILQFPGYDDRKTYWFSYQEMLWQSYLQGLIQNRKH